LKSQEAIRKAQEIGAGLQHQSIENAHIMKSLLMEDEKVTPFILNKLNVNISMFSRAF
jgi:ATP-dependent Clp protease ATP-binding subunit ClpB